MALPGHDFRHLTRIDFGCIPWSSGGASHFETLCPFTFLEESAMKITSWMKRHGLCPCNWFAKLSRSGQCAICAWFLSTFSICIYADDAVAIAPCPPIEGLNNGSMVVAAAKFFRQAGLPPCWIVSKVSGRDFSPPPKWLLNKLADGVIFLFTPTPAPPPTLIAMATPVQ
jgi:hypothetical protein